MRMKNMLRTLKVIVTQFLEKRLNYKDIFKWLDIADRHRFREFFQSVNSLICEYFVELSSTKQFLACTSEQMKWIVSNENLVSSEGCLFEALIRWYKHDIHSREQAFRELFSYVKLEHLGDEYMYQILKNEDLFKVLPGFDKSQKWKKASIRNKTKDRTHGQFVRCSNLLVINVRQLREPAVDNPEHPVVLTLWAPFIKREGKLDVGGARCDQRYRTDYFSPPIVFPNKVYIVLQTLCENSCRHRANTPFHMHKINLCGGLSSRCSPLPDFAHFDFVRVGIYIYALAEGLLSKVVLYRYDTRCDFWEPLSDSKQAHGKRPCVVAYGLKSIYIIGGRKSVNVDQYCIASDTWRTAAPLPHAVDSELSKAVVCNGKIFIVSHVDGVTTGLVHCPWSHASDVTTARDQFRSDGSWQDIDVTSITSTSVREASKMFSGLHSSWQYSLHTLSHLKSHGDNLLTCAIGSQIKALYSVDAKSLEKKLLCKVPVSPLDYSFWHWDDYVIAPISRGALAAIFWPGSSTVRSASPSGTNTSPLRPVFSRDVPPVSKIESKQKKGE